MEYILIVAAIYLHDYGWIFAMQSLVHDASTWSDNRNRPGSVWVWVDWIDHDWARAHQWDPNSTIDTFGTYTMIQSTMIIHHENWQWIYLYSSKLPPLSLLTFRVGPTESGPCTPLIYIYIFKLCLSMCMLLCMFIIPVSLFKCFTTIFPISMNTNMFFVIWFTSKFFTTIVWIL